MRWKQLLTPVQSMDAEEAKAYVAEHKEGTFTLLDVRQPGEYEKERIPGAKLVPLPELSDKIEELDPEKPVIVYWAVGGRSRAAAQLLAGKGFNNVYNLKGGIKAWQGLTAVGPIEMGMDLLRGDETPEEIIILSYGMEEGLGEFYRAVAKNTEDSEMANILTELAGIEENHKQKLFKLYLTLDPATENKEIFEIKIVSKVMEGGFTTEEFLEKSRPAMQTVPDVLNIAMMLETQALDLYSRYSQKIKDDQGKTILHEIADEEKAHLASLGQLLETRV